MKVVLYVDDQLVYSRTDTSIPPVTPPVTPPPIVPPPVTPPPPPPPPVQPVGEPLVMGSYTFLNIGAGQTRVYTAVIPEGRKRLHISIYGLTPGTSTTYTWIFPDGTEFPAHFGYHNKIEGTNIGGNLELRCQGAYGPNIPYDFIPAGNHTLKITGINPDSQLQIWPQ
jgi:hypothetical protein